MNADDQYLQASGDYRLPSLLKFVVGLQPWRTLRVVALLIAAGFAEMIGITSILPLLSHFTEQKSEATDRLVEVLADYGLVLTLESTLVLLVIAVVAKSVLSFLAMRDAGYAAAAFMTQLRLQLLGRLIKARWGYFTKMERGRVTQVVINETERACSVYTGFCMLAGTAIQSTVYVAIAFTVSWQMTLVAIAFSGVLAACLGFLVRIVRRAGFQQTELKQSFASRLVELLTSIKPLKAMRRERPTMRLLKVGSQDIQMIDRRLVFAGAALKIVYEPIIVLALAIAVYAALKIMSVPFAELLFLAFLFHRLATRLAELQGIYQKLSAQIGALVATLKLLNTTASEEEKLHGGVAAALEKKLEFKKVNFSYGDAPVLKNVTLSIPANSIIALVGPSGSGKTTILDLLAGLYEPNTGSVRADGLDLKEIDMSDWRNLIGYVPQDAFLFHDTLLANVSLGDSDVSREDVENALKAAGADFVAELDDGLDTVLGEHGSRLSGGQRQRVSLARALVRRPKLLILDEVTSALDPETADAVIKTLDTLRGEVTMVLSSHQKSIVRIADIVFRIEDGSIDQLMPESA